MLHRILLALVIWILANVQCLPGYAAKKPRHLLMDMSAAMASKKPIYDIGYISKYVSANWYPPRDGGNCTASFSLSGDGKADRYRIIKSDGDQFSEKAAREAVEKTHFIATDFGDARFIYRFKYNVFDSSSKKSNIDVELKDGGKESAVIFVNTQCAIGDRLVQMIDNNRGVKHLLKGEFDRARQQFKMVLRSNPKYKPAIHNLKLLEARQANGSNVQNK